MWMIQCLHVVCREGIIIEPKNMAIGLMYISLLDCENRQERFWLLKTGQIDIVGLDSATIYSS
jgi:hypothetical protein